jgi:hypothetical protein
VNWRDETYDIASNVLVKTTFLFLVSIEHYLSDKYSNSSCLNYKNAKMSSKTLYIAQSNMKWTSVDSNEQPEFYKYNENR